MSSLILIPRISSGNLSTAIAESINPEAGATPAVAIITTKVDQQYLLFAASIESTTSNEKKFKVQNPNEKNKLFQFSTPLSANINMKIVN